MNIDHETLGKIERAVKVFEAMSKKAGKDFDGGDKEAEGQMFHDSGVASGLRMALHILENRIGDE